LALSPKVKLTFTSKKKTLNSKRALAFSARFHTTTNTIKEGHIVTLEGISVTISKVTRLLQKAFKINSEKGRTLTLAGISNLANFLA
jgi:riboflavin synthase alpha subunit